MCMHTLLAMQYKTYTRLSSPQSCTDDDPYNFHMFRHNLDHVHVVISNYLRIYW